MKDRVKNGMINLKSYKYTSFEFSDSEFAQHWKDQLVLVATPKKILSLFILFFIHYPGYNTIIYIFNMVKIACDFNIAAPLRHLFGVYTLLGALSKREP